jgi:IMP dehydrogenase
MPLNYLIISVDLEENMSTKPKIAYYNGNEALAFSDVYLMPRYSDILSRYGKQIDTSAKIARSAPKLNIPFIAAGMDTVCEDKMATVFALNGGLGEIHRNNPPEKQAELVRKVKELMRVMETNPPMVSEDAIVADALNLLQRRNRGYVIVYKGEKFKGNFSGMATDKDFIANGVETKITKVMTPLNGRSSRKLITTPKGTSLKKAVEIMKENRVEKLPVVDKDKKLVGVYTIKDYQRLVNFPNAATDKNGRLMVGAAIGVHDIDVDRALKLIEMGVDVLFLDIAHGHSIYSKKMVHRLKVTEKIKKPIVIGNVATREGVLFANDIGADGIKVGIGPGFVCKTRNVAGTGIPQITAVLEAKEALANKRNAPPIISDGGVREPGDPPKALACGADCVMIGSVLAGTDKSPGDIIRINGILQKRIRGMASKAVLEDRKKLSESTTNVSAYAAEGRETFTPYQGSTEDLIQEYIGGLRSAMSYVGAHTVAEMQKAKLIHISSYGSNEQGRPLS